MAWTAFPTWVVGQVSTASDWNTYVAANVNFLATPPTMRAQIQNGTNPNITTSGSIVPFNITNYDSAGGYNNGTYTYTVQVAGLYQCYALIKVTGGASTYMALALSHNGAATINTPNWPLTSGGYQGAVAQDDIRCVVSDTVYASANVGATNTTYQSDTPSACILTIKKVSN